MKRRFPAFLLALFLAVGLLPITAAAAEEQVGVTFSVLNGTWADGESSILVPFSYGHILEAEDIPEGMEPFPNFDGGYWMQDPVGTEITEEMTFLYNFQPLRTVTFDACGGTFADGEMDTSMQLISGEVCGSLPEDPTLDGCFFMGWFTGEDGFGSRFTAHTAVEEDLVVYARWAELVNITCDGNGGEWTIQEEDEEGEPVLIHLDAREIQVPADTGWEDFLPEEPLWEGWLFDGWSKSPDGDALEADAAFGEDSVVFAQWQRLFTLDFQGNGPGVEGLPLPQTEISNTVTLPEVLPARPGHDFIGWNTQADGSGSQYRAGETITLSEEEGNATLYAIWQQCSCTVTFDGLSETDVLWGEAMEELPELECAEGENRRFVGWETADGLLFDPNTPITESLTLYPRWADQSEITFRIVNGLWVENSQGTYTITVDAGSDLTDKLPTPQPGPDCKETGLWDAPPTSSASGTFTYTCDLLDTHTVTFFADGVAFDTLSVFDGRPIDALPTPPGSGEGFLGWYTAPQGGEKYETDRQVTKDLSLYARWGNVFTLRYDANAEGETVKGLPADRVEIGEGDHFEFTVSDSQPSRPGYRFLGWAEESGVPAAGSCTVADTLTLYAQWQRDTSTFLLHYDANGGENAPPPDVQTVCGPSCTFLVTGEVPTREGWLFRGWAWTSDAVDPEFHRDSLCSVTGEATLYAVWAEAPKNAVVSFLVDGTEFYRIELLPGQSLTLPKAPTRPGYVFQAWNTCRDGSGANVNEQTLISKDLVVYAQWQACQQVTVDFYDRTVHISQTILSQGTALGDQLPGPPSRNKYLFTGWNTAKDGSGRSVDGDSVIHENITLYAVWQKITHASVTFTDRGREVSRTALELGAQIGQFLPQAPAWEGHRFLGWNTQEDGTGKKAVKSMVIREDTAFCAQWEEIEYIQVSFMDRSREVSNLTLELGKKPGDEMPATPTRSGYTFKGWNLEPDGSGSKLYKSTSVHEDVTVYAQWAPKKSASRKSSNPKTGDRIFTAAEVLVFSGLTLVALPLIRRKKR